jgi:predicted nucleic acid-binding protein
LIEEKADYALLAGNINVCRDKDDNLIIETAINGNADYIVSRDDDVKLDERVAEFLSQYSISVLTVKKFIELIE